MSTPTNPRREHPSTYVVQDRSNQEELTRLQILDQIVTAGMGGVLPEQPEPTLFQRVLDVGCGTGGWIIEMARTYPSISLLVGVDVSSKMVEYARTQAAAQGVSDRVQFRTMDALRMLEFPADHFNLVNQRYGMSYLRKWDWPKLLQEFQRVLRPGGVIRLTESDIVESPSPAFTALNQLAFQAFCRAGHFFTQETNGVTSQLAHLLHQHGLQDVQTQAYVLKYRSGSPEGQRFAENIRLAFRTMVPYLRKWSQVPEDYETIYQQAVDEMQQPNFVATAKLLTAWGKNPASSEPYSPNA